MFRACRDEGTLYEGKPGRESRVWTKINRNLQDLNAIKVYTEQREQQFIINALQYQI